MSVRIGHHLCLGMLAGLCMANVWESAERPTLVLGYPEREKKPYMAEAPNNAGIYQAILKRAAERVGAELKIERLPKKRIFQYMSEGRVDLYPGNPTAERSKSMAWILLGMRSRNICLVRADVPSFRHLSEAPPLRLIHEVGDSHADLVIQYP